MRRNRLVASTRTPRAFPQQSLNGHPRHVTDVLAVVDDQQELTVDQRCDQRLLAGGAGAFEGAAGVGDRVDDR